MLKEKVAELCVKVGEKVASLINVKTIATALVLGVFCRLALRGDILPDNVMYITTTVIAFYFGTQHEKKNVP